MVGRIQPNSYAPYEPHFWIPGKIVTKNGAACRQTSERKPMMPSYDDVMDHVKQLAMPREMTPVWTSSCASSCKGKPQPKAVQHGGPLYLNLARVRAADGNLSTCR